MIISKLVDSLPSFLSNVSALSKDWKKSWMAWLSWFCGEESAEWLSTTALQPKLYRNGIDCKIVLEHE